MQICVRCAGPILAGQASCDLCGAVAPLPAPPGSTSPKVERRPGASLRICARCAGPILAGQSTCGLCGAAALEAPPGKGLAAARTPRPGPEVDDEAEEARKRAPNCYKCTQFMITHQVGHSRGCKLFGFKGDELPSYVVFQVTGKPCVYFEKRHHAE